MGTGRPKKVRNVSRQGIRRIAQHIDDEQSKSVKKPFSCNLYVCFVGSVRVYRDSDNSSA